MMSIRSLAARSLARSHFRFDPSSLSFFSSFPRPPLSSRLESPYPPLPPSPRPSQKTHRNQKQKRTRRASLAAHLEAQPWGDKSRRPFLSREQEYVGALKAALGIWQQMRSGELSYDDAVLARKLVNMPSGFELHIGVSFSS